jgi:endonuclease/exonuclease/phosphatase family metal-dependent hydrolase
MKAGKDTAVRVLTWNLFHGRAVPDRPRSLFEEFAATLAAWEWDVALLQEVPPWWAVPLGRACRASVRMALTSRNLLLPLRRVVAERRPDLAKSNGGGANVILARGARIAEHRRRTLSRRPERRVMHAVRLEDGTWVTNLHAQGPDHLARADVARAARTTLQWAAGAPAVLGGDLNLTRPRVPGFEVVASRHVDHIAVRGLVADGRGTTPDRHGLSDHDPLLVALRKEGHGESV